MHKYFYSFLLAILFLACQKETEPGETTEEVCRLLRMVQGTHDGMEDDTTFLFEYDTDNRLKRVIWRSTDLGFDLPFNLLYDAQSRVTNVTCEIDPALLYSVFQYDSQGRLKEVLYQQSDSARLVFEYGNGEQPVGATRWHYYMGQWSELGTITYTFVNGNMTESDYGGPTINLRNYEYDTIPNVLGVLPLVSFSLPLGYYEEFLYFNKNMLKKYITDYGPEYHIRYALDSGNVAQSVGCWVNPPATDTTQRDTRYFQYECR